MKKQHYNKENGSVVINGKRMSWVMQRSKTASAFGLRGSRIFYLELYKDDKQIGLYDRGWKLDQKVDKDDEEGQLCLSYLVGKYGQNSPKKKKEMGSQE